MAKLSRYQRDVVIRCNHGVVDGPNDYVSQYRFMEGQEVWVPVDRGGTETTEVGGTDDGWFPAKSAPGPRHHHHKIRCRTCGKELSITGDLLQNLLEMAAPVTEPVTIAGLQRTLEHWRSSAKRYR